MHDTDYETWRRERDLVEEEMRRLMVGATGSGHDCRLRRGFFAALVERREAAARRLLQSDRLRYRRKWKTPTEEPPKARDITSLVSGDAMPRSAENLRF